MYTNMKHIYEREWQAHAAHAAHVKELLTMPCARSIESVRHCSSAAQLGKDVAQLLRLSFMFEWIG